MRVAVRALPGNGSAELRQSVDLRHARFVGRAGELETLRRLLRNESASAQALYVSGPPGIGKTSLLWEFAHAARELNVGITYLDARSVAPNPRAFLEALGEAMGLDGESSPLHALADSGTPQLLLLDTYELLTAIDGWIRDDFLPALPKQTVLVVAGCEPPSAAWRANAGWRRVSHPLALRSLSREESRLFLARRDVRESQQETILRFAHGHPLALALVTDVLAQQGTEEFSPETAPDVIHSLVERFVQQVPSPEHRAALDASALLRTTTEAALAATLGIREAHALFTWLRELSFVEAGPDGLFPHDLAREALLADLRWRNPDRFVELLERASSYSIERAQNSQHRLQERALLDYIYLQCHHPAVRPFFEWRADTNVRYEYATASDVPALLDLVELHEGPQSRAIAAHWLKRQLDAVVVARNQSAAPEGLLIPVSFEGATAEEVAADPGAASCAEYLRRHAPLRPGERATVFRFWMARDGHQAVSNITSVLRILMLRYSLATPRLAFIFVVQAHPEDWQSLPSFIEMTRLHEADFEVGGLRYGVIAIDWRRTPPAEWLRQISRKISMGAPSESAAPPPAVTQTLLVLDRDAFAEAVREALKHLHDPRALAQSPLLRSKLVVERCGAAADTSARVGALQALVQGSIAPLAATPKGEKLHRALDRTYLRPARTQEAAAELLGLPFSTYRRHLGTAVEWLVETLWTRELGEPLA